jgi:hypothetical protein
VPRPCPSSPSRSAPAYAPPSLGPAPLTRGPCAARPQTWLRVAEALWTSAGIRSYVVVNGSLTRQSLMDPYSGKFYKQHRIQVRGPCVSLLCVIGVSKRVGVACKGVFRWAE